MNLISKGEVLVHRSHKIINDIFDADQSSSQLQVKHGEEDTFDSLFSKQCPNIPSISQNDIDSIQSQLNFKRQQREEMINHLRQYQALNRILMQKYQKLENMEQEKSAEISPNETLVVGLRERQCNETSKETSLKPRSKRKLSLLSQSFRS